MTRRSLLQLLACVPCLGWVKPEPSRSEAFVEGGYVIPEHIARRLDDFQGVTQWYNVVKCEDGRWRLASISDAPINYSAEGSGAK